MTNEERIEECKRLYPLGTVFRAAHFTHKDINDEKFHVTIPLEGELEYIIGEDFNIHVNINGSRLVTTMNYGGVIYYHNTRTYATIVKESPYSELNLIRKWLYE